MQRRGAGQEDIQPHVRQEEQAEVHSDAAAAAGNAAGDDDGHVAVFECNVCLESASEPVVTQCGHLYCWPCLYQWLHSNHNDCPVCKAGVTRENVIPIYARGRKQEDPRQRPRPDDVPDRPSAHRPEPVPRRGMPGFAQAHFGNATFTAGVGFFPSLFGLQFHTFTNRPQPAQPAQGAAAGANPDQQRMQQQQEALSRLFCIIAVIVLLCLLFM